MTAIEMYLAREKQIRSLAEGRLAKLACGRPSVTFALDNYEPWDEDIITSVINESGDFVASKVGATLTVTLRKGWDVSAEKAKVMAELAAAEVKK